MLQDVSELSEVRRERREARRDGLSIADIGEDPREHGQRRLRSDRWDNAALGHQAQQPDCLDQDGLAAGVRTRDEHGVLVAHERQVEGDRLASQERVAATMDFERSPTDRRDEPVYLDRVACPGAEIVKRDAHVPRRADPVRVRAQRIRELPEHPQHLMLLVHLGCPQGVAQFDDLGRLEEDRGARG